MRKNPHSPPKPVLEYFRQDPWWIRLFALVIDRMISIKSLAVLVAAVEVLKGIR
jgi:hypothetical protein